MSGARVVGALPALALLACAPWDTVPAARCTETAPPPGEALDVTHFHGDARRLGWNDKERELTADAMRSGDVSLRWRSPELDHAFFDGVDHAPLIYASPLYLRSLAIRSDTLDGVPLNVVLTATSHGWIYALQASDEAACGLAPGEIVWRTRVARPAPIERLDQYVPMGVLGTPVVDRQRDPPRLYAVAHDADRGWQAVALDAQSGALLSGWPVAIDDASLGPVNSNGPARFHESERMSQRGALQLSPEGDRLYVAFGTYWGNGVGWLAAIDTESPRVAAAFSAAPSSADVSSGGMWGSAGPAVDEAGRVWVTSGNSPGSGDSPKVWGSSLLQLSRDLHLERSYTPFNYCVLDEGNMDLGASQPALLPALSGTTTPDVVAFGGKQGVVYLVDRTSLSVAPEGRPLCSADAASDASLLPPEPQPQFGTRGPLSVFGPYSDVFGSVDHAKMRTKLAYFRDASGQSYLFASGSTKAAEDSVENVAPSVAKLALNVAADGKSYLEIVATHPEVVMANPGPPIVSSDGSAGGVVWVLDRNAPRSAGLLDSSTPRPVLYAFDAGTLALLWRSEEGALGAGGKYQSPIVVDGRVLVATDRIEAYGLR